MRSDKVSWRQLVQTYVKSTQLLQCPSNTNSSVVKETAKNGFPAVTESYSANPRLLVPNIVGGPQSLSSVDAPASKIMIGETLASLGPDDDYGATTMYDNWSTVGKLPDVRDVNFAGHLSTSNYLFADGHVKSLRPSTTASPFNMWGQFSDTTTGTNCTGSAFTSGINCDQASPGATTNLNVLQTKYN